MFLGFWYFGCFLGILVILVKLVLFCLGVAFAVALRVLVD